MFSSLMLAPGYQTEFVNVAFSCEMASHGVSVTGERDGIAAGIDDTDGILFPNLLLFPSW